MDEPAESLTPGGRDRELAVLGRVARSCAHDFNNIFGAIEGYAVLSQRAVPEDSQLWRDLGEMRKILSRAVGVTRQLSVFGRRTQPKAVRIPAGDLLARLEGFLAGSAGGVRFSLEKGRDLPAVAGDLEQLVQALCAAALNAAEAAGPGGAVGVKAEGVAAGPAGRPFLRISVSDSGPGFSAEALERLFEPFFTTKRSQAGKGLGLAAAYGTLRSHGGRIEAANGPDGGARVVFFLPAAVSGAGSGV